MRQLILSAVLLATSGTSLISCSSSNSGATSTTSTAALSAGNTDACSAYAEAVDTSPPSVLSATYVYDASSSSYNGMSGAFNGMAGGGIQSLVDGLNASIKAVLPEASGAVYGALSRVTEALDQIHNVVVADTSKSAFDSSLQVWMHTLDTADAACQVQTQR